VGTIKSSCNRQVLHKMAAPQESATDQCSHGGKGQPLASVFNPPRDKSRQHVS